MYRTRAINFGDKKYLFSTKKREYAYFLVRIDTFILTKKRKYAIVLVESKLLNNNGRICQARKYEADDTRQDNQR